MTVRNINTDLKNSLLPTHADYKDGFLYAHLVKFEKPIKHTGRNGQTAKSYSYITDGSQDILFNDGSVDFQGNANGSQQYVSNKLLSVSAVSETVQARASSINLDIDAISLSTAIEDTFVTFTSTSFTVTTDLTIAGFSEGDEVYFYATDTNSQSPNNYLPLNSTVTARIDRFTNDNKTAHCTVMSTASNSDISSFSTSPGFYDISFASKEVIGLLNAKGSGSYAGYINREVFIYKAHLNSETGAIIGAPYLLFKGIITSAKLTEDPEKRSVMSWSISSHWGDFVRVNGRITSDSYHRGLDGNGFSDPAALKKPQYATDLGFLHSEQAINIIAIYQVTETRQKMKMKRKWYGSKKYKLVEYQVEVDREADLRFNLEAKYLPVIYGVQKIDSIPIFVDTLKDSANTVFVAYAICEGEIGGLYDIYFDDQSSICIDKQDADTRTSQTSENTIDVLCSGRMDRGDTLNNRVGVYDSSPTRLQGLGRGYGGLSWKRDGWEYEVSPVDGNVNLINTSALTSETTGATNTKFGLQHEETTSFQVPVDTNIIFHSGTENQKADGLLSRYALNEGFKVQSDYFDSTSDYWGPNHQLLDTAYVVAQYTISDGETQIPHLDFVVRGKLIDCYNYDLSYVSIPAAGEDISNFGIGDAVELYNSATNALIESNTIADIFTLPEESSARIRLLELPDLGNVTAFYVKKGSNTWHMITHNHVEHSGTVAETLREEIVNSSSTGTTTGVQVDLSSTGLVFLSLSGPVGGNLSLAGVDVTVDPIDYAEIARLLGTITYEGGSGGTIDNIGENTNTTDFDTEISYAYVTNGIALDPSTSNGTTDDYYSGYTIELTHELDDGSFFVQEKKITSYDSTNHIAFVETDWNPKYLPLGGENSSTASTYKILSKKDKRVSLNPAMQLLDYLTSVRYGRGLLVDSDINLDTFKKAGRECDTRSDITTVGSYGPPANDVYKYADGSGRVLWQATASSTLSINGKIETTWSKVSGKLGYKWLDWKSYQVGDLVWYNGKLYEKTTSAGTITESSGNLTGNVSQISSTLTLTKVSGLGSSTMTVDLSEASSEGNPVVKKFSRGRYLSGYSLYDSDDVKYWKYLGWNSQDQREVTRHQTNAVIDTSASIFDNINSMLNHFNGILRYANGKYELEVETKAGTFDSAEVLSEDDIIGPINIEDSGQRGTFNTVTVGISDPQNRFESRSISFFDSNYLVEDRNISKKGDFKTPYVTNYFNARINARQYLEQSRYGLKISFKMPPKGLLLVAGSLIQLNYSRFKWTNKLFRITNLTFENDCLVQVTAEEHNDSAYLISSIPKQGYVSENVTMANDPPPSAPSNLTTSNTSRGAINLSWTNSATYNPANYEVEIYRSTQNSWTGSPAPELIAVTKGSTYSDVLITSSPVTVYYWIRYAVNTASAKRSTTNRSRQIFSFVEPLPGTSPGVSGTTSGSIDGVTIQLNPSSLNIPEDGTNPGTYLYTGTATSIRVKVGTVDINYDSSSPYGEPSFRLGTITGNNITPGSIDVEGSDYVQLDLMSGLTQQFASINYEIILVNSLGEETTFTATQTISVSGIGSRGPGRWNVPVVSLPTTSGQADTAWDANWAGRPGDPVTNDQAYFYTGTESSPTSQSVWIYGGSTWTEQTEVLDGSLLIDDSVGTDQIGSSAINAGQISTGAVTAGTIAANAVSGFALASGAVAAENIVAGAINADKIAANAITTDKLAANAITTDKLAANSITTETLATNSITANQISVNSITSTAIKSSSIQAVMLTANSIYSNVISANAITSDKIAASSITAEMITANAITSDKIAASSITAEMITANAIEADKIAANAITTDKLAASSITADQIAANAITTAKLAASSIIAGNISANAITTDKLAANAITADKLAANAITADKISANAITSDKIAANAITADQIAANAISTQQLQSFAVSSEIIVANAIVAEKIAASAIQAYHLTANLITADKIAANSIEADKIAASSITAEKIISNAIQANHISANSVTADAIVASAISADKIAANAITTDKLAANAVTANSIAANSITSDSIAANSITSDMVSANSVVATLIDASSVTANDITTSSIAALSANLGNITAGTLKGGNIPEASSAPSFGEQGAFLDLNDGKLVFGSETKYIWFDGTDLNLSGVTIDANSIVNASSKMKVQDSGGTAVEVDDLNFGTNLSVTTSGTSPIVATINALSDPQIRALLSATSPINYSSATGEFSLADLTLSDLSAATVITSAETFANNDTTIMTSAAIEDKILSYGYTTNVGDITGVNITAGTGLTGSVNTTSGTHTQTLNVSGLTISEFAGASITTSAEAFADNDTTIMTSAAIDDRILSYGYTTNVGDITGVNITAGAGLTGSVNTTSGTHTQTLNIGAGTGITVNADDIALSTAGPGAGTYGSTGDATKIDTITLDAYGRVTAVATGTTGDITRVNITAGDGLSGTQDTTTGDHTQTLAVDSTVVRTSGVQTIAGAKTFSDAVTINANLTVTGTTTSVNSNEVNIGDAIILLNSDETGTPTADAGIEIERGTSTNVKLIYRESGVGDNGSPGNGWSFGSEVVQAGAFYGNFYGDVVGAPTSLTGLTTDQLNEGVTNLYYTTTRVNSAIDGRVTAAYVNALNVDADTLDGIDSGSFLRSDAADSFSGTLTWTGGATTALSLGNGNIIGVNQLTINDPGEGILFTGTNNVYLFAIDDANDNIMNFSGAAQLRVNNNIVWHTANDGAGSGLDADTLDGNHASAFLGVTAKAADSNLLDGLDSSYFAVYDHIRSLGVPAFTTGTTTTAGIVAEMEGDGAFDSYSSVFKTSWSYAGNIDISDGGGFTETAGASFLTWTDNSSDTTRGNITMFVVAPNTGGSAYYTGVYNDQGSGYSPGWREIWNSGTDGSGSGLDADTLDGQHGSYYQPASTAITTSNIGSQSVSSASNIDGVGFTNTGSNSGTNADTIDSNGISYYTAGVANFSGNATDGALFSQRYSSLWQHQIAGDYRSGQIALRGKNNNTWQSWRKVWDASNDGSGSGLDADLLDGYHLSTTRNSANTVPVRDANGYLQLGWINTTSGSAGTTAPDRIYGSYDGYIRYYTPANLKTVLGYLTTADEGSGNGIDADTVDGIHGASFLRSDAADTATGSIGLRAGGAHLGNHEFAASSTGTGYSTAAIELRESNYTATGAATPPILGFHWGGIVASTISMDSSGTIEIRDNPGTGFEEIRAAAYYVGSGTGTRALTTADEGSGNGIDADTLDGSHASAFATSGHNHTYNVNDSWLRDNGDNAHVKLYGNTRQMVFRTDGTTEYSTGIGGYAFTWQYGGDASGNRRMLLGSDGRLWTSYSGWLDAAFLGATAKAADSELLDGLNSTRFSRFSTVYSSSTDWDTIFNTSGQYGQVWHEVNNGTSWTNGPGSGAYSYGGVFNYYGSSMKFQWYIPHTASANNGMWYRTNWGGNAWYAWARIWDSNNDGSGSGLDADLLDGVHGSSYLRRDTADTYSDIRASGSTNTGRFISNSSWGTTHNTSDGYIQIGPANSSYAHIYTDRGNFYFNVTTLYANGNTMWHTGNDGPGSGLDADTVDGIQASSFLQGNQTITLSGAVTGSGTTAISTNNYYQNSVTLSTNGPDSCMEYQQASSISDTKLAPSTDWHNTIRLGHGDPYSYYGNTIALRMTGTGQGDLYTQCISNNSALGWNKHWHANNDGSGSGLDADLLDGVHASGFVSTTNNSGLNSDTRNTLGVTRLFRRDSNSNYSVQTHWTGTHWWLRGYNGDTFHAECRVSYADAAGNGGVTSVNGQTGAVTVSTGNTYTASNGITIVGTDIRLANTGSLIIDILTVNQINANHIAANSITAAKLEVSSSASVANSLFLDGPNKRIDIKDGNNVVRVRIGQL